MNTVSADPHPLQPPLVRFERVSAGFGGSLVFSDLSLCLYAGEHLALLGPNGSGKSTLMSLIQGELRQAQNLPGRIFWSFEGREELSALSARQNVRTVSPALQRSYVRRGWNISGEELLLSGLDNAPMVYGEMSAHHYERAAALAESVGATPLLSATVPAMSQGQLRLMLILRALMSRPALLLLDEPFDGLDGPAREHVGRSISLAMRDGVTVLASAHRQEDIPQGIKEALVLRSGGVTRLPAADLQTAVFSNQECLYPTAPSPAGSGTSSQADTPFVRAILSGNAPLLRLEHVDVFIDRRKVLSDINWTVLPGEQWLVSGRNGSGKSTLLRLLYGEEFAAFGGAVLWCGRPRPALEELHSGVGYVSDRLQDTYDYNLSAEDVVISGLGGTVGVYHEPLENERALARSWLARLGLEQVTASPFHSLSTGTARRVLLARALAGSPPVLLLDEPCSGLDKESRTLFLRSLPGLAAGGVSIIYVSHHEQDKIALFTHELRLESGRAVFAGPRCNAL